MSDLAQRMFVELLSDREGHLTAFQLIPGTGDLSALLATGELTALASRHPCLMLDSDLAALGEAGAALLEAGCRPVSAGTLVRPANAEALADPANDTGTYLAGDWYLQPLVRPLKDQTGSRALALKLLQLVVAEAETREIEEIFRREPTLSYHLLRLVNSPAIGTGRRIESFTQAIMVLGRRQLRRWLNLLLFTSRKDDPRAPMQLSRVSLRARLLELLAREMGDDRDGQERAFMVGMFSMLGVTFGMPLDEVLKPLALDPSMVGALLRREGDLGALLAAVEAYENRNAAEVVALIGPRLPADVGIDLLAIEACAWMISLVSDGGGDHG